MSIVEVGSFNSSFPNVLKGLNHPYGVLPWCGEAYAKAL